MKRIICLALATMLLVISSCAFAQTSDKMSVFTFANPSLEMNVAGEKPVKSTLTGLEVTFEKGKIDNEMGCVFGVLANGVSAIRAMASKSAENVLITIDGLDKAIALPVGILSKFAQAKPDKAALADMTKDFHFTREGREVTGFMYGANLSADKFSLNISNDQFNDIIDALSAMSSVVGMDVSALKNIQKSMDSTIWLADGSVKVEIDLKASNDTESVEIPISILGRIGDGIIDVAATAFDKDVMFSLNAHASIDDEHPLRPAMNVVFSVTGSGEEILNATVVTGNNSTSDASTYALSFTFDIAQKPFFKLSASKRDSGDSKTYVFKAGLRDQLTATYVSQPYEDETFKGEKGEFEIDLNIKGLSAAVKSDLTTGVKLAAIDLGDLKNIPAINFADIDQSVVNSLTGDLYRIAARAISVLSGIPELADLLQNELVN